MADPSTAGDIAKSIGDPIGTFFGWVFGFIPEGPLRALFIVVVGLCLVAIPYIYKYYLGVLAQGAKPEGSIERQDYDRLRAGLAGDNLAARLYAKWLTKFLDWIERFFGDAGMADRTLFPHAFGLKKPAPLWTAPALDRCLLLALVYPIATIILIWAISGHVGPAEAALGLEPDLTASSRGLIAAASFGFSGFGIWRGLRAPGWKLLAMIAVAVAVTLFVGAVGAFFGFDDVLFAALAFAVAGAVAFAVAVGGASAAAVAGVVAFAAALAAAFPVANAVIAVTVAGAGRAAVALGVLICVAGAVVVVVAFAVKVANDKAIAHRRQGIFLAVLLAAMFILCLVAAGLLAPSDFWVGVGPLLLFLGLLTVLNAPFDWASLGLTRALLQRGLELGGWWPYFLALIDACLAAIIIALLALAMVVGVQAFDELAVHGGGEGAAVLPLDALFDGIAKNPAAPEYWWAYALLLSTMIPSLINLAIGGMALTRGIPGVSKLLLRWIPEGRDVPDYRRPLAALALTTQMFAGAFLGIAAQAFLAWGLLYHVMPSIGLDLLWLCQKLADFDIPGSFFRLAGIIP